MCVCVWGGGGGGHRGWSIATQGGRQWEVAIVLKCGDLRSGAPRTILSYPGGGGGHRGWSIAT